MSEEAKEAFDRINTGREYNPQGDLLLGFWSYIVAHCNIKNLKAEKEFLENFNVLSINNYESDSYLATTFIATVEKVYAEYTKQEGEIFTQNVNSTVISTSAVTIPKGRGGSSTISTTKGKGY